MNASASFDFGLFGEIKLDFDIPDGNTALVGGVGDDIALLAIADENGSFSGASQETGTTSTDVVAAADGDTTLTTALAGPGVGIGVAFSENEDYGW